MNMSRSQIWLGASMRTSLENPNHVFVQSVYPTAPIWAPGVSKSCLARKDLEIRHGLQANPSGGAMGANIGRTFICESRLEIIGFYQVLST
ncbi:hypothetical protein K438DRAFT_1192404 [Mycena galopus ATCC 62051]|nr:hypothetical protein K438DRAFT_1192404 [Mycena galopus ATCC 62051]